MLAEVMEQAWVLWELLVLAQPLMVLAPSPGACVILEADALHIQGTPHRQVLINVRQGIAKHAWATSPMLWCPCCSARCCSPSSMQDSSPSCSWAVGRDLLVGHSGADSADHAPALLGPTSGPTSRSTTPPLLIWRPASCPPMPAACPGCLASPTSTSSRCSAAGTSDRHRRRDGSSGVAHYLITQFCA